MKVLIDTNIVLDVLLDRAPWVHDSSRIWEACATGVLVGVLPASVLSDIFYIARRATTISTAQVAIGLCLATFVTCAVDRTILDDATTLTGRDFEDNIQIACAHLNQLDALVTRNPADFADAPVLVLTPPELLARL